MMQSEPSPTPERTQLIRDRLLPWFDENQRELPWRHCGDAYGIWVSEIMLQQTRVATVIEYWNRWMREFPTVESLAAADLDDVMKIWSGLGYYRRARFLHSAANVLVEDFDGELPETATELQTLPGIGRYTAGAVASQAFGKAAPIVDGNVIRILSRLFAIPGDPRSSGNQKILWRLAERLVDPERPGDFNQSMMELGATVCTPRGPACVSCPVRQCCEAFGVGAAEDYPEPSKKTKVTPARSLTAIVYTDEGSSRKYFIEQRPPEGLLANLWQFPSTEDRGINANPDPIGARLVELGLDATKRADIGVVEHIFSHLKMNYEISAWESSATSSSTGRWVDAEELSSAAFSTAMRKVFSHFQNAST